jgi:DNA-binding NarL/FixJ family response regulator
VFHGMHFKRCVQIEPFDWHESCRAYWDGRADDSDAMRSAIVSLLSQEPHTELVGQAKRFAQTIQVPKALKPDILRMDLRLSDESEYPPASVKVQLSIDAGGVLALSRWNDERKRL